MIGNLPRTQPRAAERTAINHRDSLSLASVDMDAGSPGQPQTTSPPQWQSALPPLQTPPVGRTGHEARPGRCPPPFPGGCGFCGSGKRVGRSESASRRSGDSAAAMGFRSPRRSRAGLSPGGRARYTHGSRPTGGPWRGVRNGKGCPQARRRPRGGHGGVNKDFSGF